MNKQIKNLMLVMITILPLSACGQSGIAPVATDMPEPVIAVTESPTEAPTAVPMEESASEDFSSHVGLVYPPLPESLSPGFSMIIHGSDDNSLSLVSEGQNEVLWLSRLSHYDENGNPLWEVMDILNLSNIESGAILIPDGCSLNGKVDNEILAVAKNGHVLLAWRANTSMDRFEILAPGGVSCDSDKAVRLE